MNKQKGFLMLTLVLSILAGISAFLIEMAQSGFYGGTTWPPDVVWLSLSGFASVWLLYAFIRWIVIGFIVAGFKDVSKR